MALQYFCSPQRGKFCIKTEGKCQCSWVIQNCAAGVYDLWVRDQEAVPAGHLPHAEGGQHRRLQILQLWATGAHCHAGQGSPPGPQLSCWWQASGTPYFFSRHSRRGVAKSDANCSVILRLFPVETAKTVDPVFFPSLEGMAKEAA